MILGRTVRRAGVTVSFAFRDAEHLELAAWAAGFYDGEGSCGSRNRLVPSGAKQRSISVQIAQSITPALLNRFAQTVEVGKVQGPYRTKNPNAKPYWMFRASGIDEVRLIATVLWPWLGDPKREQFESAIVRYDSFVPEFPPCPHGSTYSICGPCHSAAATKGWKTRRAA